MMSKFVFMNAVRTHPAGFHKATIQVDGREVIGTIGFIDETRACIYYELAGESDVAYFLWSDLLHKLEDKLPIYA